MRGDEEQSGFEELCAARVRAQKDTFICARVAYFASVSVCACACACACARACVCSEMVCGDFKVPESLLGLGYGYMWLLSGRHHVCPKLY